MQSRTKSSVDELIARLSEEIRAEGHNPRDILVHQVHLPSQPPSYAVLRPRLPDTLGQALRARGIARLYVHQVEAIQAARRGEHVVVTTPTASGKTLCFNLPVIERALQQPNATALYIYPTKALMSDQLRGLEALLRDIRAARPLRAALLSGDVAQDERNRLRGQPPTVLLANPDILHFELLYRHSRWERLLANLSFVVLDELHTYRGVFGAHVGLILRRLRRLAERYGARPTFIAASATIANPAELAEQLVGLPFKTISAAGAGTTERRFLFWRPPPIGNKELNEHRSATTEAVRLFVRMIEEGRTVILFGRSRVSVERMLSEARDCLDPSLARVISGYKAGYTPEERRRIETDLREGRLRGVIATNALELGIDIGSLDTAILAGYPGTIMSTWQQAGRVGRRGGTEAIVVLVGADDALDQYFLRHPQKFFGATSEQAVVDVGNEPILLGHIVCAAREAPLRASDFGYFPENARELVERLVADGLLTPEPHRTTENFGSPHHQLSIRGVSREQYQIRHQGKMIATIEPPQLYREAHPGAIYLHNGSAYRIERIDPVTHTVYAETERYPGRTDSIGTIHVAHRAEPFHRRRLRVGEATVEVSFGPLEVTEEITCYRETPPRSKSPLMHYFDEPYRVTLSTVGLWVDFPANLSATDPSLHGVEHALRNALPVSILCDRRDVGSARDLNVTDGGRIYVYDGYDGGIGLAEKAYVLIDQLFQAAADLLTDCRCADGCPSCIQIAGCEQGNDQLDKHGAIALLNGKKPRRSTASVTRGLSSLSATSANSSRDQLRRIVEDRMRERFKERPIIVIGDVVDVIGYGSAIVREINGTRARVQFIGSSAWSWVDMRELRPRT